MRRILMALLIFLSGSAFAVDGSYISQLADAHDRVQSGRSNAGDGVDAGKLVGFVMAVADDSSSSGVICVPADVVTKQLVAIAKQSVRAHPETWHMPAHQLIQSSLIAAFPCNK